MIAKILVVEDEQTLNEAYEMILSKSGYDVVVAHDGQDALEKSKKFEPDLILLDLRMPILNGIGFLEKYDLPNLHPKVKVIVFSNLDTQSEIDEAYKLGAKRYILKAWASPKELLNIVEDTLKQE
jgi:DNA-binding response OmpR family regulator